MQAISENPCSQVSISHIVNGILATGRITRADETFFLRAMTAETPLNSKELEMVVNLFDRLKMGLLKVAD